MSEIVVKSLKSWQELLAVEEIQHVYWGDQPENVVQRHMLISIAHNGGLILGAFDGEALVGCAIAFLGADLVDESRPAMANLKLYSKRMVVLNEYRNRGVGYQLKLAQREFAQRWGIRLITWTFDPLIARNAHVNIRKLGATVSYYYPDLYGDESDVLAMGGASDRLQADWWLTSRRVEERLHGKRPPLTLDQYLQGGTRVLNPTKLNANALPVPAEQFILPPTTLGLVEIPVDFERLSTRDGELGKAWRAHGRAVLQGVLEAGYILTDFVHEPYEGRQRGFYVCSHDGALRRLNQN